MRFWTRRHKDYSFFGGATGVLGLLSFLISACNPMVETKIGQDWAAGVIISTLNSNITVSNPQVASGNTVAATLHLKDTNGVAYISTRPEVSISALGGTSTGTLSSVTNNHDGTYSATFTGVTAGTATTLHGVVNGVELTSTLPTLTVTSGIYSLSNSTISVSSGAVASGSSMTATLTVRDDSNNQLGSGRLTVAFSNSGGTSTGTFSSVTDNHDGTYTATFTGATGGTATNINATIAGNAVTSTLPTVTVSGGSAASIAVNSGAAQSGTVGATLALPFVVIVKDSNNNVLSGVTIDWAITAGAGSLSSASNATDAGGLSSSTLTLGTSTGTNTVTATVRGTALSTSFSATGTPGTATQLIFTQGPSNSVAGVAFSPAITVTVKDTYGNIVTGYATSIAMAIIGGFNPGSSTLSGTTPQTPSSGVSTFSDLSLNKVGTGYKLTATAGALSVTSSAFNITVGTVSLTQSIVSVSSASIVKTGTSTITLTAKDANANALSTGGSVLTFSRATTGGQSVGTIGATTDVGNGTYTAVYTATTSGTANTISAVVTGLGPVTSTSSITVTDTAPVASAITPAAFNEDTQSGTITLSYTDADGDLATGCTLSGLSSVTETQGCACDGSGVCTVKVTGTSQYNGAASFNYTVTAGGATSNAVAATLTINAVNDAPVFSVSPSNSSTNEDVAKAVTFSITDVDHTLVCNSTYLSMTSSNTAIVADAAVVWSGTAPNCTATITPVADAYGAPTITINLTDTVVASPTTSSFTLTITRLGDDALSPASVPFTALTTGSYSASSWTTMDFTGGVVRLAPTDQVDDTNNSSGFAGTGSSLTGVAYSASGLSDGSSGLKLDSTSPELELSSNWTPQYSSIVGYWKMNGTVGAIADAASVTATVGSDGTSLNPNAGGMAFASGKINQGINLDGTDDYLTVPYTASLNLTTAWTISTWVNLSAHAGNTALVTNLWPGAGNSIPFMLGWDAGSNISAAVYTGAAWSKAISSSDISFNTWQHVVGVYSGATTTLTIYRNGIQVGVNTGAPASVASNTNLIKIGRKWDNVAGAFITGKIDEVAIWNTALTATEVATLYSRQSATYAGTFASRVMDALSSSSWTTLSWVPTLPFFKELPDSNCSPTPCTHNNQESNSSSGYTSQVGSDGTTATNDLMTGIVGLWHLNETSWNGAASEVKDDSGQGNHGTATNGATTSTYGKLGNAGTFDGTNDYLLGGANLGLSGDPAFTMAAWVKWNGASWSVSGDYTSFMGNNSTGTTNRGLSFTMYQGRPAVDFWVDRIRASSALNIGQWYHIAGTKSAGTKTANTKIYVNGVEVAAALEGADTAPNIIDSPWIIGRLDATRRFNGNIDEIAIWSRALHANEIKQLYQRGASRLKYQIKSCTASDCSDNTTWKGPDGTNQTYFSELNNNSTALDGSGDVKKTLPALTLSAFTSPPSNNRYFQYRMIFETDSSTIGDGPELKSVTIDPVHYEASQPSIYNNTGIGVDFYTLSSFTETLGANSCAGAKYQLSSNNSTWWWYTGGAWTQTVAGYAEANSAAELTGVAMAAFPAAAGTGLLQVKSFLNSSGTSACEIDSLGIGGLK